MAVRVGEVAGASTREGVLRRLGDRAAGGLGGCEQPLDVGGLPDVVGELDAAEAGAVGGDAGVLGELAAREERDRQRADLEEHDVAPTTILLTETQSNVCPTTPLIRRLRTSGDLGRGRGKQKAKAPISGRVGRERIDARGFNVRIGFEAGRADRAA